MEFNKDFELDLQGFKRLAVLFDQSNTGLWEMKPDGRVRFFNDAFYKEFNISTSDSTIEEWIEIIHPEDKVHFINEVSVHEHTKVESYKTEYRVINNKGDIVWIEAQGVATFDESGNMISMVGSHTDITLNKQYSEKLYSLAYIEPVSKLYNRKKLFDQLNEDSITKRDGVLLILDFYQIKQLISLYGIDYYNDITLNISNTITATYGPAFMYFKISTSKYALITYENHNHDDIKIIVAGIKRDLLSISSELEIDHELDFTTAVVKYTFSIDELSPNEIVNRAYLTLDEAIRTSKGYIAFFTDTTQMNVLRNIFIETHMLNRLKDGEFYVEYQPLVDAVNKNIISFEALLRWNNKKWGKIFPDEFIPIAEKSNVIIHLGRFVIESSCSFISDYNQLHKSNLSISINSSVAELFDPNYASFILEMLFKYNLKPQNLTIEITESIMYNHESQVTKQLRYLKELGIRISLDDFGTGYASINNMINTPLSEVKIDRSIMNEVISSQLLYRFMTSIVSLCHDHDVHVVAEGIDHLEMADKALEMGVNILQGYLYSRPLPIELALEIKGLSQ